jgi:hypothetical protein
MGKPAWPTCAGGSGGAHPKASARDADVLWLAKFHVTRQNGKFKDVSSRCMCTGNSFIERMHLAIRALARQSGEPQ